MQTSRLSLANVSARVKIFVGFGLVLTIIVGVMLWGFTAMKSGHQQSNDAFNQTMSAIEDVAPLQKTVVQTRFNVYDTAAVPLERIPEMVKQGKENDAAFDKAAKVFLEKYGNDPAHSSAIETMSVELGELRKIRDAQMIPLAMSGDTLEYHKIRVNDAVPHFKAALAQVGVITKIAAEQSAAAREDAHAASVNAEWTAGVLGLIAVLIGAGIAWWISQAIAKPLLNAVHVLEDVSEGDLNVRMPEHGNDEVGRMAVSLNAALDSIQGVLRELGSNAKTLAESSSQLQATADDISAATNEAATEATGAAGSADTISTQIQAVAAGAEQMTASIQEIATGAAGATEIAQNAVGMAQQTMETVTKLGQSSEEVGNVVKVITSIAGQTNLLALNATIEAARAGDAGKGFAVVADEVKDLAQETAKATDDIYSRVEAIQADTADAVAAIEQISEIIAQINNAQLTIASAVEEQTATTGEMTNSVSQAAQGSTDIAQRVTSVAAVAERAGNGAEATATASAELAQMAASVDAAVSRFRY